MLISLIIPIPIARHFSRRTIRLIFGLLVVFGLFIPRVYCQFGEGVREYRNGNYEEAIPYLESALEKDKKNEMAKEYLLKSILTVYEKYQREKEYEKAVVFLEKAFRYFPNDPRITLIPIPKELYARMKTAFIRQTIAVGNFVNITKEDQAEWLRVGIPEMVCTTLSQIGGILTVDRARLAEVLKEQALGMMGIISEETAPQVGKLLGATAIIIGSYRLSGDDLLINARLIKTETAEILRAETGEGKVNKIDEIVEKMVLNMAGVLGKKVSDQERKQIENQAKMMLANLEWMSWGEVLYQAGNIVEARGHYKQALKKNPDAATFQKIKDIDLKMGAVAVLKFNNNSGAEYNYLQDSILETLTEALTKETGLCFVEKANLDKAIKEQELGLTGIVDEKTAPKVGKIAGAKFLLTGNYQVTDKTLKIFSQVIDSSNGSSLLKVTEEGEVGNSKEVVEKLAGKIASGLLEAKQKEKDAQAIQQTKKQEKKQLETLKKVENLDVLLHPVAVEKLNLSAEQLKPLKELRGTLNKDKKIKLGEINQAEAELKKLLASEEIDFTEVETKLQEIGTLRARLRYIEIVTFEKGKALLTPEQKIKMKELLAIKEEVKPEEKPKGK